MGAEDYGIQLGIRKLSVKSVNVKQLESKLMWPTVTAVVEAKSAVESKATHMGPETELKSAEAMEVAANVELALQTVVKP